MSGAYGYCHRLVFLAREVHHFFCQYPIKIAVLRKSTNLSEIIPQTSFFFTTGIPDLIQLEPQAF